MLTVGIKAKRQFYTYRDPKNPKAQITGQISDKTHVVDVEFDVDATDEFEMWVHPVATTKVQADEIVKTLI